MQVFLHGDACLMEFLRRELDDPAAAPCGRCAICRGEPLVSHEFDRVVARAAVDYLRRQDLALEPRLQWPTGSRIPAEQRAETGRVLCEYGDGGWGTAVKEQKVAGHFDDELVDALAERVRRWSADPPPAWVTCVPSTREPDLVASLAERLASRLRLPFHSVVAKTRETQPQHEMENSAQQYRNITDAFAVTAPVPAGPVLLVDDIVDSRWTLTVVAAELGQTGSGPVFPIVLARAQRD
jgi:ATP-dependent DNA helicase RecQ